MSSTGAGQKAPKGTTLGTGNKTTLSDPRQEGIRALSRRSLNERRDAVNVIHRLLADASMQPLVSDTIVLAAAGVAEGALARLVEDEALASELGFARSLLADRKSEVEAITASDYHFEAFLNAEYLLLLQHGVSAGAALELVQRGWTLRQVAGTEGLLDTNALLEVGRNLRGEVTKAKEMRHKDDAGAWKDKIRRAGLMLGGALIVGVNSLIGLGVAPATGGFSVVGAAVSNAFGGALMGKALEAEKAPAGRPLLLNTFTVNLPPGMSLAEVVL